MQPKLTVKMVPTADLVPYAGNAKEHPDWQVEQIAASIDQFGFDDPVGVWHDADGRPVIVEGHGRVLAAKELGIESVPTIALDHLDDEGRRAYTLAHNKLTTNTGYDADLLAAELDAIEGIDMSAFGFDEAEALEELDAVEEDEPPAPSEVQRRVGAGEVWRMGDHVLVCGDATDPDALARLMGGESADLLLTDPPYNVDYASKNEMLSLVDKMNRIQDDIAGDRYDDPEAFERFIASALRRSSERMRGGRRVLCVVRSVEDARALRGVPRRGAGGKAKPLLGQAAFCAGAAGLPVEDGAMPLRMEGRRSPLVRADPLRN